MSPTSLRVLGIPLLAAALAAGLAAFGLVVTLQLLPADLQEAAAAALAQRRGTFVMLAILLAGAAAWLTWLWQQRRWQQVLRLAEAVSLLGQPAAPTDIATPESLAPLGAAINRLAAAQRTLLGGQQAAIEAARNDTERERARLAALVDDLDEAIVVCNAEARVLLYNRRAARLFEGTGRLGLGRDLSSLVDASQLALVRDRFAQPGARRTPQRFMMTTPAGRLVRLRISPLLDVSALIGLIVLADDVTTEAELAGRRQQALQTLADRQQAGLAALLQQLRRITQGVDLPSAAQQDFDAFGEASSALSSQLGQALRDVSLWGQGVVLRDDMRALDLLRAAQRRIESRLGLAVHLEAVDSVGGVSVDSFLMTQVLTFLAVRISEACDPRSVALTLHASDDKLLLGLRWAGTALSQESALGWELEPLRLGGEASNLSVREVLRQHDTELRYERHLAATESCFSFALPVLTVADPVAEEEAVSRRDVACDFALLGWQGSAAADERMLADLAFTVFDTETTGLDTAHDEIIQIGALRILRGKLLRDECFNRFADTAREISPASLRIHGISRERLRGQPGIAEVLRGFHDFAADSVLVGHNVAFDMRFLQRLEVSTGLRFDHAVLDTMLLSSILHPNQASHSLEAIAERFGVSVVGRHDALADATMTARIFICMIPLLAERGIRTLSDARLAQQESRHAQIRYG
ncbi:exonuclease domain-containing protein [Viridibacterium curvum]|uniref:DNA-directed DNA polymerase n=1 Tax=Viridibacterium curvum TaxID=1101404 RepID=A0ABP9QFW3_9RHOO